MAVLRGEASCQGTGRARQRRQREEEEADAVEETVPSSGPHPACPFSAGSFHTSRQICVDSLQNNPNLPQMGPCIKALREFHSGRGCSWVRSQGNPLSLQGGGENWYLRVTTSALISSERHLKAWLCLQFIVALFLAK